MAHSNEYDEPKYSANEVAQRERDAFMRGVAAHNHDAHPFEGDVRGLTIYPDIEDIDPEYRQNFEAAAKFLYPILKIVQEPRRIGITLTNRQRASYTIRDGKLHVQAGDMKEVPLEAVEPFILGAEGLRTLADLVENPTEPFVVPQ